MILVWSIRARTVFFLVGLVVLGLMAWDLLAPVAHWLDAFRSGVRSWLHIA
jgi:hypothetical protein